MPYMQYQYMSDADVDAIVAYLRTVAPLEEPDDEKSKLPFPFKAISNGIGHDPVTNVPAPDPNDRLAVGKYLVHVGHCGECHSAAMSVRGPDHELWLAGSVFAFKEPTGKYPAPNLTPDPETGIGKYTVDDFMTAIRTGRRLDGQMMQPPMAFFTEAYAHMTDDDLRAMGEYLFSLKPVHAKLKPRELNEVGERFAEQQRKKYEAASASTAP
jgi:mono/diheme cytochrome c family protein